MSDLISRQSAIDALTEHKEMINAVLDSLTLDYNTRRNQEQRRGQINEDIETIKALPSAQPERKKGKWTEKHHAYSDEESVIEEWQSCRCSECGRYDTRPYMYYFSEPNYCSYCGADMRGETDE